MKRIGRERRHKSIARRVRGCESRPRLVVFRSKKHIYAQIINDDLGKVMVEFSTLHKEFKAMKIKAADQKGANEVGKMISEKAQKSGIKNVCFDRGGYKYHGRVKKLAEGAREGGLKF
ncbi:MAG: 50S ribosomal protein L18 [Candidatus Omnitrophota bacterium]